MREFLYDARDPAGAPVQGRIAAENSALAVARLRSQGLSVERIRPAETAGGSTRDRRMGERLLAETIYPVASGVGLTDLAVFYRQMATLIGAGMPLYQCLVSLAAQTRNARLRTILLEAQQHVMQGGRLSEVMDRHRYVFSDLQRDMVRTAEFTGTLESTLLRLAEYLEREIHLRRMISRLTLYPKIVLLSALFILGGSFFSDGMPAFSKLIVGSIGRGGYGGVDYLKDTLLILIILLLAFVGSKAVAATVLYRSPTAGELWERFKFSVPGVGKVSRAFAITRFGRALSALYGAGVPLSSALESAGRASGSRTIAVLVNRAILRVERGEALSQALASGGFMDPLFLDMLRTGEQTGNLDAMVSKVADHLEAEAETRAHQYSHIFATAVYLAVAILVGFAVVSFYMSYGSGLGG